VDFKPAYKIRRMMSATREIKIGRRTYTEAEFIAKSLARMERERMRLCERALTHPRAYVPAATEEERAKRAAYMRAWSKQNRGRVNEYKRNCRARKKSANDNNAREGDAQVVLIEGLIASTEAPAQLPEVKAAGTAQLPGPTSPIEIAAQ
jgi:hypothetical protein